MSRRKCRTESECCSTPLRSWRPCRCCSWSLRRAGHSARCCGPIARFRLLGDTDMPALDGMTNIHNWGLPAWYLDNVLVLNIVPLVLVAALFVYTSLFAPISPRQFALVGIFGD